MTQSEVEELVKPTEDTATLVEEWLLDHGIKVEDREYSSTANQWITIDIPVSKVEEMLGTTYAVYEHEDGSTLVRAPEWSLPKHLHEHIDTIQPTTAFLRASPNLPTFKKVPEEAQQSVNIDAVDATDSTTGCVFTAVTPTCLRNLYNTINYKVKQPTKNQIGFTNYLGQVPSRSDASIFLTTQRTEAVSSAQNYKEVSFAGGPLDNGTNAGVEADLDVETILAQVYPMNVTSYSTGGSPPFVPDKNTPTDTNEPYLTWLDNVNKQSFIPQTISTSYGDDEQSVPLSYAKSVCQGFAALGAKGHTLFFSSGDSGVGTNGTCTSNDGKNTAEFLPAFPASCPYITAVGGTRDYPEIVAYDTTNGYASGSGFSNYFAQPSYQSSVVNSYVASLKGKYNGLYNKSGRAYPDLAAQGFRYVIVYQGAPTAVDGTSCSSPTTSSIFALVNDALISAGKAPLGFLNPLLYSGLGSSSFNDVVSGSSYGCNTTGFSAAKGWDVASGWGTPDFAKITKYLGVSST